MVVSLSRDETAIEAFDHLLDTDRLLAVFQDFLSESLFRGATFVGLDVREVRNRTHRSAAKSHKSSSTVVYEATLKSPDSGRQFDSTIYLRGFMGGRSSVKLNRSSAAVLIPVLDAYAWTAAADPQMPGLWQLHDPGRLPMAMPPGFDGSPPESQPIPTVVRYKPEDRCTTRIRYGPATSAVLYAKTFASVERCKSLAQLGTKLSAASKQSGRQFTVPEVVAVDVDISTLWLRELAGTDATSELLSGPLAQSLGNGLLAFHSCGVRVATVRTAAAVIDESRHKADVLAAKWPDKAAALVRLIEAAARTAPHLAAEDQRLIHGAFRLRQIRVRDSGIGILDFDSVAIGDPAEDLADMIADIGIVAGDVGSEVVERFVCAYSSAPGSAGALERIRWHLPLQLLKRAFWLRGKATNHDRDPMPTGVDVEVAKRIDRACEAAGVL